MSSPLDPGSEGFDIGQKSNYIQTDNKEHGMKYLIIFFLLFIGCTSPSDPVALDTPGFTSNSVPGEWIGGEVFGVRLTGQWVEIDKRRAGAYVRKHGTITVQNSRLTFRCIDTFDNSPSDAMHFDGQIEGSQIIGEYWMNYPNGKGNPQKFIFRRVK